MAGSAMFPALKQVAQRKSTDDCPAAFFAWVLALVCLSSAASLTNVTKGGTPRSPARAKTGGTPVPKQGDSRPQWAPAAMGGTATRKRAGGGAVEAT